MIIIFLCSVLSPFTNVFSNKFLKDILRKNIDEIRDLNEKKNYLNADQFSEIIDELIQDAEKLLRIDVALPSLRELLDNIYKVIGTNKTSNKYAIHQSIKSMNYIIRQKEILLRKYLI